MKGILYTFPVTVTKYLTRSNLNREGFSLPYNFSLLWWACCQECELAGHTASTIRKQRANRKWSLAIKHQSCPPVTHDLQQPSNFLKALQFSESPARGQVFKLRSLLKAFSIDKYRPEVSVPW